MKMKRLAERSVKISGLEATMFGQVTSDKTPQNATVAKKPANRQGNQPLPAPTQIAARLNWLPQSATARRKAGCGQDSGPQTPPLMIDITTKSRSTLAETKSTISSRAVLITQLLLESKGIPSVTAVRLAVPPFGGILPMAAISWRFTKSWTKQRSFQPEHTRFPKLANPDYSWASRVALLCGAGFPTCRISGRLGNLPHVHE